MPARSARIGVVQVRFVVAGHDQQLVGRSAPERADHGHPLVGEHQPVLGLFLGVEHRAQQAVALEAGEPGQLVGGLARDERHGQQLAVGVLDRRAGLPAAVDDRLAVAQPGGGVGGHAITQRLHDQGGVAFAEIGPAGVWSGARTSTSWIPLAGAWVYTGPRWVTTMGSLPLNAG